jgi:MFS family permease
VRLQYRHFVLGALLVAYVCNAMDRAVLSVLLPQIKSEFGASDTQLGLLGGLAFAFFYATFGVPLAAWADRGNRRDLLALCIAAWSLATAACGLATSFAMLLAARIATAIGEAGGGPTSQSLLADYFAMRERATALSIYALGVPIGAMLGNLAGGWVAELYGWRAAFVAVGLPGIAVALLVRLGVREPARGAAEAQGHRAGASPAAPLGAVLAHLAAIRSFRQLSFAAALHAFVLYGANLFNPAFLARSHGMTAGEAGSWMAAFSLVSTAGTFLGGYFSDRASDARRDPRWYMWIPAAAILLSVPLQAAAYLVPETPVALAAFVVLAVLGASYFGPAYAMTQALAPVSMRAVATSLLLFVQTLVGLGLGPLFVGVISDALAPELGPRSLAAGLVAVAGFNVLATVCYLRAARTLREDLAAAGAAPAR